jgi:Fic family protein
MIEPRLLVRLDQKKAQLDALRPLPDAAVRRLRQQLTVEWVYNSNAIQGSSLSLPNTQFILETDLTVGGKSLREHLQVINQKAAIDYVTQMAPQANLITPFHVHQIHKLVLTHIDDKSAGEYRTQPARIGDTWRQAPDSKEIPRLMSEWSNWLNRRGQESHPIQRAALAHQRLTAICPFSDGNGRTARLVMNLMLMREGYPPTIILSVNRFQYARALALADEEDEAPWINLVGQAVERGLTLYLEACTPRPGPPTPQDEWIPLREAAQDAPYGQEYLSLLARKGHLEAIKRGRVWHTTRRAVAVYRASVSAAAAESH